jgi:GNAT superfamily N-acetyltransferase
MGGGKEGRGVVIMRIINRPVSKETLIEYSKIPVGFEVKSVLDVEILEEGLGGTVFRERRLASPYVKHYGEPDEPTTWLKNFDTADWVLLFYQDDEKSVGGLTVACQNPEIIDNRILIGIDDLAVVWDIRVHPGFRHQGIGTKLFQEAIEWARNKGYKQLSVETQNTNVPACKFNIKQGCRLGGINRYAYYHNPSLSHETQLEWHIDLQKV